MGTSSCGFHRKGGLPPFGHLRRGYSCTRTNEVFHGSMDQLQRFRLHFDQRFLDFLWNVKIQNNDGRWALYWLGLVSSFLTWCTHMRFGWTPNTALPFTNWYRLSPMGRARPPCWRHYLPTSLASDDVSAAAMELGQTSSAECHPFW